MLPRCPEPSTTQDPCARLYTSVDWAATSLGPVDGWSAALRNSVSVALNTRFPVTLFWGPEFVLVYNEAYVEMIADKHPLPWAVPRASVFPEAWDVIGPMMQGVLDGGGATWQEDDPPPAEAQRLPRGVLLHLLLLPGGGADGDVEGVMDIATETTARIIVGRRLQLLDPARRRAGVRGARRGRPRPRAGCAPGRGRGPRSRRRPHHRGRRPRARPALPEAPLAPLDGEDLMLESDEDGLLAWLPLAPDDDRFDAVLVVRLNPRLPRDNDYLDFLRLVAATLTQALERVSIREAERTWSEALQRSLLAPPARIDGLEVAVRYQPAAEVAQVGGDWYDAFRLPDGTMAARGRRRRRPRPARRRLDGADPQPRARRGVHPPGVPGGHAARARPRHGRPRGQRASRPRCSPSWNPATPGRLPAARCAGRTRGTRRRSCSPRTGARGSSRPSPTCCSA